MGKGERNVWKKSVCIYIEQNGDALNSSETGKGGDTYITYTDASNNSQTSTTQQSTYVPITNSANKTSSMDD